MFGGTEPKHSAGYDCYILPYNYSNHYLSDEYDYEQRINYFTEDIGLNNYYFFFRNQLPFFLGSADLGWGASGHPYRGEEYLYGHKQLLARYYLERLSNQLGSIEDYDYNRPFYAGFWPTLRYPNGMQFPSRPWNSFLPKAKLHQIHVRIGSRVFQTFLNVSRTASHRRKRRYAFVHCLFGSSCTDDDQTAGKSPQTILYTIRFIFHSKSFIVVGHATKGAERPFPGNEKMFG